MRSSSSARQSASRFSRSSTARRQDPVDEQELVRFESPHRQPSGVKVDSVLLEEMGSQAGACIVEQAQKWPADLIVCGTHGPRGVRRLLLGSDAEYVVRHTRLPVLLLRGPDEREAAPRSRSGREPAAHAWRSARSLVAHLS